MNGWDVMVGVDRAVLPGLATQQVWLRMGWGVVLAWLALTAVQCGWPRVLRARHAVATLALLIGLWVGMPGAASPAYWLGLAFQAPSGVAVLLCLGALARRWALPGDAPIGLGPQGQVDRASRVLSAMAVAIGWILLLDTLALWPVSLYARGFGSGALGVVALLAFLPAVVWPPRTGTAVWHMLLVPLALLLMVTLRLPTGNVWDAVLDPCLWLVLQWQLVRDGLRRYRNNSCPRSP